MLGENQEVMLYDLLWDKRGDAYKGQSLTSMKSSYTTCVKIGDIIPSQETMTVCIHIIIVLCFCV